MWKELRVRRAFSVMELTIVLAVVGILSAIAMPAAAGFLDRIRVRAAVIQIESTFAAARHIAIARAAQASVHIDTVTQVISVTVAGDTLRRSAVGREQGVDLTANRSGMSYSPTGIGYGAANLSVGVRRGLVADTIVVSRLGRVRH